MARSVTPGARSPEGFARGDLSAGMTSIGPVGSTLKGRARVFVQNGFTTTSTTIPIINTVGTSLTTRKYRDVRRLASCEKRRT